MDDRGGTVEGGVERVRVEDGGLDQFDVGAVEVGAETCGQVIEGDYLIDLWTLEQRPSQVRSDESGSAGDNDLHCSS